MDDFGRHLWIKAQQVAKEKYEEEWGLDSWDCADKYEREDRVFTEYENLKEKEMLQRDSKGRFCKANENINNTNKGDKMMNNKEMRMETLKSNGINTNNFFNLNMNIPVGSNVEIFIDGVPYTFNSSNDEIVKKIINNGYVFNSKTDGRFICAQTFKMLNRPFYNWKTRQYEVGFDAYLRNRYPFMYQFDMMLDEVHRLSKMERNHDPEFSKLSSFFTKEVVVKTCEHYLKQLKKYIQSQPNRKCNGVPYVKLNKFGNVFIKDLNEKVYRPIERSIDFLKTKGNYTELEVNLKYFMSKICKLPADTPKCSQWKDAFKGKGAYVTLLNIVKFHGCRVQNYETGEILNRDESVVYVENLLNTYKGEYWRFHELLKATIKFNNFDLRKSIDLQYREKSN